MPVIVPVTIGASAAALSGAIYISKKRQTTKKKIDAEEKAKKEWNEDDTLPIGDHRINVHAPNKHETIRKIFDDPKVNIGQIQSTMARTNLIHEIDQNQLRFYMKNRNEKVHADIVHAIARNSKRFWIFINVLGQHDNKVINDYCHDITKHQLHEALEVNNNIEISFTPENSDTKSKTDSTLYYTAIYNDGQPLFTEHIDSNIESVSEDDVVDHICNNYARFQIVLQMPDVPVLV
jgi:hypothetical protein